jgi:hypothetical protein
MRVRKRIEQCFGWAKTIGQLGSVMVRGLDKVDTAQAAVINLGLTAGSSTAC